jgi:hypothetical protein
MKTSTSKPWFDNEFKIAIKSIMDDSNESLKSNNIDRYKSLIKRKKMHYINRNQENLLHLSKLDPKIFYRKILTCKNKKNNIILLSYWSDIEYIIENKRKYKHKYRKQHINKVKPNFY